MTLTALNDTLPGVIDPHFCVRNLDAVLLTTYATDITMRMTYEKPFLPLDGLLSQAGEVFFKVENTADIVFNLSVPYSYIHSPYFGMHLVLPVGSPDKPVSGCTRSGACWMLSALYVHAGD